MKSVTLLLLCRASTLSCRAGRGCLSVSVHRSGGEGGAHREQGEDQVQAVEHEEDPGGSLREISGLPGDRAGMTHRKYMVPVFIAFSTSRTL